MGWRSSLDHEHRSDNVVLRGYLVQDMDLSGTVARTKFRGTNGTMNENLDYIQSAGMVSNPGSGKRVEAIAVDPNGDSSQRTIIAVAANRDNAPKASPGETIIYSPLNKDIQIKVFNNGGIEIKAPGKDIKILDADNVDVMGILKVNKATSTVEIQNLKVTGQTELANTTINGITQVGS